MLSLLISISLVGGFCFPKAFEPLGFEVPHHIVPMERHYPEQDRTEAERLWEQAIAAKGGRERLHSVRNMVISARAEYRTSTFKKNQIRQEGLYVLPNKVWSWNDLRPDVFGLRVTMYNHDTKMKYIISEGEPHHLPEPITEKDKKNRELLTSLLPELLETEWSKPVLVSSSIGRIGLRTVNIVQTTVGDKRVDFALDQKTHLPVRVSYYDVINGKTYITALELSDYVEISGIKVPQKVKYDDGTEYKQTYQFNVRYNEDIFIHPTTIEAGPEAWKSKT
jgi:hypothetical protein